MNIEREKTRRAPDLYYRTLPDGSSERVNPDININLYILCIAHFKQYEQGLDYLSLILQYFQSHPVIDRASAPELDPRLDKLIFELNTLTISEQGEIWNALRTSYMPSLNVQGWHPDLQ